MGDGQFTEGSGGSWVTKMTHCQLCPRLPCAADCVLTRSAVSTHYPHPSRGKKTELHARCRSAYMLISHRKTATIFLLCVWTYACMNGGIDMRLWRSRCTDYVNPSTSVIIYIGSSICLSSTPVWILPPQRKINIFTLHVHASEPPPPKYRIDQHYNGCHTCLHYY